MTESRSAYSQAMVIAVFVALSVLYIKWTSTSILGSLGGDNATYYLTAGFMSPYHEHSAVEQYVAYHSPYPPLMPGVLALFGGGDSLLAAHVITTVALLCVFAEMYWLSCLLGFSRTLSVAITVVFASAYGTFMQALEIHSESFFMAAVLATICCVRRSEYGNSSPAWLLAAGCCAGLSLLARSAGVACVAAFVGYLWLHRPPRFMTLSLLATIPGVAWAIFGFSATDKQSYLEMMSAKFGDVSTQADYWQHVVAQVDGLRMGWLFNFEPLPAAAIALQIFGGIGLLGGLQRIRQVGLDGLFVAAYLGVLLLWPFMLEPHRYVLPVMPLIIIHAFHYLQSLPIANQKRGLVIAGAVAMCFAITMPLVLEVVVRFDAASSHRIGEWRHSWRWYDGSLPEAKAGIRYEAAMVDMMRRVGSMTGTDDCVFAPKPTVASLYSGRLAVVPPSERLDDEGFFRAVRESGCRYAVAFAEPTPTVSALYPILRLGERASVIDVAEVPGKQVIAILARINVE